jgi:hypothetical protein
MANKDDAKMRALEQALEHAKRPNAARQALAFLFPRAENYLKTYVPSGTYDTQERRKNRRLSVADYASNYFRLDPHKAGWGRSELERLFSEAVPAEVLSYVEEKLASVEVDDVVRLRRQFLEDLATAFPAEKPLTRAWLKALVDFSPNYMRDCEAGRTFLGMDNAGRLRLAVQRALLALPEPQREALLQAVIPAASDLTLLCAVVRALAGDQRSDGAVDRSELSKEAANRIRGALLAGVRELAAGGKFWSQAGPREILWFWWGCGHDDEVRAFTAVAMKDQNSLRHLLNVTVNTVYSSNGNYEQVNRDMWSKVVNVDELEARAKQLIVDASRATDQPLATRFLRALEKWEAESR